MKKTTYYREKRLEKSLFSLQKIEGVVNRMNQDELRQSACAQARELMETHNRALRRQKIFRRSLLAVLAVTGVLLLGLIYYRIDASIPSVIRFRADQEQELYLGFPGTGDIISVSGQGESNIPVGKVSIDLSKKATLKLPEEGSCKLQVKLFGIFPIKEVGLQTISDRELIPMGCPIGLYVETEGVLVVGTGEFVGVDGEIYSPARDILKSGDYIIALNGEAVSKKSDLTDRIAESRGKLQTLTVRRDEEEITLQIKPMKEKDSTYKLGIWVRDNAQGIGTMTYMDADGNFAALGHGITDVDTSTLMQMHGGRIYDAQIVGLRKGSPGDPGEVTGRITYTDQHVIGEITHNSNKGISGVCNEAGKQMTLAEPLPIALRQEIEKGYAQMLCTIDEKPEYFDIEIVKIHKEDDRVNRGLEIRVTDQRLLELTGGIVQGMSGSPIIQNGRIVGAVTHVLVNDSTRGYGIFIEKMLETADKKIE